MLEVFELAFLSSNACFSYVDTFSTDPVTERMDKMEKSIESIQGSLKSLESLIGTWMKATQPPPVQECVPSVPQVASPTEPTHVSSVVNVTPVTPPASSVTKVTPTTPLSRKSPLSPVNSNLPTHHRPPLPNSNKHCHLLPSKTGQEGRPLQRLLRATTNLPMSVRYLLWQ